MYMSISIFRFGHQDKITAIDSLSRERAVTSGGRDASIRIWKIIEESQLVFNAHSMYVFLMFYKVLSYHFW